MYSRLMQIDILASFKLFSRVQFDICWPLLALNYIQKNTTSNQIAHELTVNFIPVDRQ